MIWCIKFEQASVYLSIRYFSEKETELLYLTLAFDYISSVI